MYGRWLIIYGLLFACTPLHRAKKESGESNSGEANTGGFVNANANTGQIEEDTTGQIEEDTTGQIEEDTTGQIEEDTTGQIEEDTTGQAVDTTTLRLTDQETTCPSPGITYIDATADEFICYWAIPGDYPHENSKQLCVSAGGHLAYIPSEPAARLVYAFLHEEYPDPLFHLGYSELGGILTVEHTGQIQNWGYWRDGEPNEASGTPEECVAMITNNGKWLDTPCDLAISTLCSKTVIPEGSSTAEATTTEATATTDESNMAATTRTATSISTDVTSTSDSLSCYCECDDSIILHQVLNITKQELQRQLVTLRKETAVDYNTLSSTIRKKTSASDPRPSSASVGYVGVALLVVIFGGILGMDLPRVIVALKRIWS